MLNSLQLLVEDGVGSKSMVGALWLDLADVLNADILLGQALSVLKVAHPL